MCQDLIIRSSPSSPRNLMHKTCNFLGQLAWVNVALKLLLKLLLIGLLLLVVGLFPKLKQLLSKGGISSRPLYQPMSLFMLYTPIMFLGLCSNWITRRCMTELTNIFFDDVLESRGFGSVIRCWIRSMLVGGSLCVRINDFNCPCFVAGKGLKQGDPMSPILSTIWLMYF